MSDPTASDGSRGLRALTAACALTAVASASACGYIRSTASEPRRRGSPWVPRAQLGAMAALTALSITSASLAARGIWRARMAAVAMASGTGLLLLAGCRHYRVGICDYGCVYSGALLELLRDRQAVACFLLSLLFGAVSRAFTAAEIVQLMGFLGIHTPDTGANRLLRALAADAGGYALVPLGLTVLCNVLFSAYMVDDYWIRYSAPTMRLIYGLVGALQEYTAICLTGASARLADANPCLALSLALPLGQLLAVNPYALIARGAEATVRATRHCV